jgi:hypothetical protein
MYPNGTFMLTDPIRSAGNDYKLSLLGVLMMTMFLGLPLLWTGMMGWIGISMGNGITSALKSADESATKSTNSSTPRRR